MHERGEEFLLQDRQSHLGRDEFCFRLVTRLTSSEGVQNGSQVSIRIDPSYQRLVIHHIAVIRDGAVILHATPSSVRVLQQEPDLAMHLYDENRTIVVDLPGVRKGDLIDQLYTTKGENPAHQGRFSAHYQMGYGVPIGRDRVRLVIPTDRSVDYREHDVAGLRKVLSLAGAEEWMWDRAQVPCTRSEDRTPGWHRTFPSLEVSEFGTLEDLRQWAIGLYDIDRSLSGQLADVVRELKSVRDPLARIDSAVHLVQREVRYLGLEDGISAYRPHPPAQVLHQRFGDCKDQSLLLVTLLNAIGVEAWPALVNTNEGRRLPQSLPRPGLFDHCVVLLRHAGQEYWIDPTRTHGMGSLKERTVPDFAYGLVLDEKRSGWSALPYLRRGAVELEERFTLDSIGGGAILDVLTVYRGQQADMQRAHLAGNSLAQVGKSYLDFYSRQYGGATALGPIKVTDDPTANILKVAERYSLMDLWEGPDSTGVYVLNAEATYLRDVVFTSNVRFRATPIALSYPFEVRQRIILKMPEPWSVEIQPKEINGFGIQYTQATRAFADTVLAEFYYSSDSLSVAAEDSPAFHDQQEQIMDDLGFVLTYGGEVDGLIVRQRWAIAAILLFVALAIWGAIVLYRFDPPRQSRRTWHADDSHWRVDGAACDRIDPEPFQGDVRLAERLARLHLQPRVCELCGG
ncbi:MAG: DUF3857 domain-containing protein [Flavobacteriales bacterium]|nr:DUF3857 domain-containing protein [Flavobacteriales bacterium]